MRFQYTLAELNDLAAVVDDMGSDDEFRRVCAKVAVINLMDRWGKEKFTALLKMLERRENAKATEATARSEKSA